MPKPILALTQKYQKSPQLIKVVKNELTVASIDQFYYEIKSGLKVEVMTRLINQNDLKLMLVFCNTKRKVDEVVEELQQKGFSAEGVTWRHESEPEEPGNGEVQIGCCDNF